jgi:hypothetical protein
MIRLAGIIILLLISLNAYAKNSGEDAQNCVSASNNNGEVTLQNNCGEKVFAIWCGDIKYTKKRCGDGPSGGFFTQSDNIGVGGTTTIHVKPDGNYSYGACKGSISFGNDGTFKDYPSGSYTCLER